MAWFDAFRLHLKNVSWPFFPPLLLGSTLDVAAGYYKLRCPVKDIESCCDLVVL